MISVLKGIEEKEKMDKMDNRWRTVNKYRNV